MVLVCFKKHVEIYLYIISAELDSPWILLLGLLTPLNSLYLLLSELIAFDSFKFILFIRLNVPPNNKKHNFLIFIRI